MSEKFYGTAKNCVFFQTDEPMTVTERGGTTKMVSTPLLAKKNGGQYNVGSKKRFNYTVMGDTVNLAARLEHANKVYGTEILMSEATYRRLGNAFLVRELDLVQVQGRAQPVTIYELMDLASPDGPPA